jgi:hypothetical protein
VTSTRATNGAALLLAIVSILLAGLVIPAAAGAQGAENEYNLDLPGSHEGEGQTTGAADASSSDSGGFPVIVVVLIVGAGAAAGFAAYRMRKPGGPGAAEPDEREPPKP